MAIHSICSSFGKLWNAGLRLLFRNGLCSILHPQHWPMSYEIGQREFMAVEDFFKKIIGLATGEIRRPSPIRAEVWSLTQTHFWTFESIYINVAHGHQHLTGSHMIPLNDDDSRQCRRRLNCWSSYTTIYNTLNEICVSLYLCSFPKIIQLKQKCIPDFHF